MTPELKAKIASKNKIVEFYQRGLLSDAEFNRAIKDEEESEDGFEDMENEEAEHFAERAERDAQNVWEDGRL